MSVKDIFNSIQVDDRTLIGGQPTEAQLREVAEAGYEAVINLATIDPRYSLPDERALCQELKLRYHHIPVAWDNPKPEDFQAFCAAMRECADRRVFVHCAANYRVSLFYSVYARKHLGWTSEQASALRDRIWRANPEYVVDEVWVKFQKAIEGP